jgi:hypothetical protein
MWQSKGKGTVGKVDTVDGASMFGDFDIKVDSTAKAGACVRVCVCVCVCVCVFALTLTFSSRHRAGLRVQSYS